MRVLALDITGTPRQWISSQDAIIYASKRAIAWSLGEIAVRYRGGIQRDGTASYLETHSIIAISGNGFNPNKPRNVVLNNRALFGRDRYTCGYCGKLHHAGFHVVHLERSGAVYELHREHYGRDRGRSVGSSYEQCNYNRCARQANWSCCE